MQQTDNDTNCIDTDHQILYRHICGSVAHGTNGPNSDVDTKGVYLAGLDTLLGFRKRDYKEMLSDTRQDNTVYELERYMDLLLASNPNILESLFIPDDCVLYMHPAFEKIINIRDEFVTSKCADSYISYAKSQISKASGLNKMINKEFGDKSVDEKDLLDFIYIGDFMPIKDYLKLNNLDQRFIGLTKTKKAKNTYYMYYNPNGNYKGIVADDKKSMDVSLSSITMEDKANNYIGLIHVRYDDYGFYLTERTRYLKWVKDRNQDRYKLNLSNGKGCDCKNMSHCVRMLRMGIEIIKGEGVNVRRSDKDFLLDIKHGKYSYEELMNYVNTLNEEIAQAIKTSPLRKEVDVDKTRKLLIDIRKEILL